MEKQSLYFQILTWHLPITEQHEKVSLLDPDKFYTINLSVTIFVQFLK